MYNKRRAQGLSLEMIAIGAIAIVVLVIVITIFITSMQSSQENLKEATEGKCEGKTAATPGYVYKVLSHEECINNEGSIVMGSFSDVVNPLTEVCCLYKQTSQ
ncbi:MAG: hypothetical protein PWQ87_151 [Candidatus Woesearchaeota archaeon]|nr:hypothetical protein [Candidatus Woesearchaeota archaeon]